MWYHVIVKINKLLKKAINNPGNLHFEELQNLLERNGFECVRTSGSHHQYYSKKRKRLLPIQEKNGMAKEYQVRQFLSILEENDVA